MLGVEWGVLSGNVGGVVQMTLLNTDPVLRENLAIFLLSLRYDLSCHFVIPGTKKNGIK